MRAPVTTSNKQVAPLLGVHSQDELEFTKFSRDQYIENEDF